MPFPFLGFITRESIQPPETQTQTQTVQFSGVQSQQMQRALTESRQYISDAANTVMRNHPDVRMSSAQMVREMRAYIENPHSQFGGRNATPEGRHVALAILDGVRTSNTQRNPEGTTFTGASEQRFHSGLRDEITDRTDRLTAQIERIREREFGAGANVSGMNPAAHPLTFRIACGFLTEAQRNQLQPPQSNAFQPNTASQPVQQPTPRAFATMDPNTFAGFNRPGVTNVNISGAPYTPNRQPTQENLAAASAQAASLARTANREVIIVGVAETERALREAMTQGSSTLTLNHSSSTIQFMEDLSALAARNDVVVAASRGQFNTIQLTLTRRH